MEVSFVKLENISKYFSKVVANKNVSFSIRTGEVVALLGENGAGKSTIMKILYGLYKLDEGKICVNGKECIIKSPKDAMKLGISMIQQHFSLVQAHTVAENIILGNTKGIIDKNKMENEIQKLIDKYNFMIKATDYIKDLSVGEQQKVEILKALYQKARLIIMDEPTAVLTPQESENLMEFIRTFVDMGNSVVFITHKLKEVMTVADRIIVMRNGEVCGKLKKGETNESQLSYLMMGKKITPLVKPIFKNEGRKNILELKNIYVKDNMGVNKLDNITFSIMEGQVVGIAGVSGNGQEQLCNVINGILKPDSGEIYLNDKNITNESVKDRISEGIGYVPSNRHRDGMISDMTLSENVLLRNYYNKKWWKNKLIDKVELNEYTDSLIKEFDVKSSGHNDLIKELSGGNQQKLIVAREVYVGKKLIIFDQPTRGLDLGAINHVHKIIIREAEKGRGVLLISTELKELFDLSDEIAILYRGRIQGIFKPEQLTTEKIGLLMAGFSSEDIK